MDPIDPKYITLAKSIRQVESGGNPTAVGKSGEFGAYQFMPSTWAATAPKYGVNVPLQQATLQQQNEVAVKQLAEWGTQHPEWNVGNYASAWNAGPGKPNAYLEGNVGTNSQGVNYDTPAYARKVAETYQQFKQQGTLPQDVAGVPTPDAPPSLAGFGQNVIKSGAGLLAGVGETILHPIQTIQNVGGAAVGGLEKVAGQTNDNTQKFDNLVGFFKDRYGSVQNLEKTLYTDPVGVAADLSTLLGGAGLVGRGIGLAADAAKLSEVGNAARTVGKVATVASDLTNPLTPLAKGAGALVKPGVDLLSTNVGKLAGLEPATIDTIRTNPASFTPQQIADVTRESVGNEVASALSKRLASLDEAGAAYSPIRQSTATIPVPHNYLEEQIRSVAGLEVKDGKILPTSNSQIRESGEISKLQHTLDLYKPSFQNGKLSANEFLNLRQDLANVAYNDLGKKSTNVARITDQIRHNLNEDLRKNVPGLDVLDERFSSEKKSFQQIKKGLLTKDGKLTDTAYSLIANAGNKGNAARLARLEEILPGITQKLTVLKAIEDIQKSLGNKVGTYGRSIAEYGGIVGGAVSGNLTAVAAGIAAGIISDPNNAVKIIRAAETIDPQVIPLVLGRLARYATIGTDVNTATGTSQTDTSAPQTTDQTTQTAGGEASSQTLSPLSPQSPQANKSLEDLAKASNFDLQGARNEGYTDEEIANYLNNK